MPAQVSGTNTSDALFSADGHEGEDLSINLWDLGSGKRIKKMTGHTASIYSLAFSAESSLLVSGAADWTVRCWDVKNAGGLPGKHRENGMVNGNHGAHENGNGHTAKHEESNHTYVVKFGPTQPRSQLGLTERIYWLRSRRSGRRLSMCSSHRGTCV